MKRVLAVLLGAVLIASLSLVVSCQKQEEAGHTGEKTSGYSEKAADITKQAGEQLEKAAGYGEKAVQEATEKAGGYGKQQ